MTEQITEKRAMNRIPHVYFEPDYLCIETVAFCRRYLDRFHGVKPHQTVTKRYILEAHYTKEVVI